MFTYIVILNGGLLCLFFVENELKTLLNEINSDLNKRKDIPCSCIVKMQYSTT